jgi:hypothetical protein
MKTLNKMNALGVGALLLMAGMVHAQDADMDTTTNDANDNTTGTVMNGTTTMGNNRSQSVGTGATGSTTVPPQLLCPAAPVCVAAKRLTTAVAPQGLRAVCRRPPIVRRVRLPEVIAAARHGRDVLTAITAPRAVRVPTVLMRSPVNN